MVDEDKAGVGRGDRGTMVVVNGRSDRIDREEEEGSERRARARTIDTLMVSGMTLQNDREGWVGSPTLSREEGGGFGK